MLTEQHSGADESLKLGELRRLDVVQANKGLFMLPLPARATSMFCDMYTDDRSFPLAPTHLAAFSC